MPYVYKVNDKIKFKQHVGKYANFSVSAVTGQVFAVSLVTGINKATVFARGDVPKYKLPNGGKYYDLIEVEVTEKCKS